MQEAALGNDAMQIQAVYDRMDLATEADRARFDVFVPSPPQPVFDVVISTTSDPFDH